MEDQKLVQGNRITRDIPEMETSEAFIRGFSKDGSTTFVSQREKLLLVGKEETIALEIDRVERIATSPSGNQLAVLRSKSSALHGEDNLHLSVIKLNDLDTFSDMSEHVHPSIEKPFSSITTSEVVPIRNSLMGYSGKWYEQGYSAIHFLSENRLLVTSGHECHIFRIWDRRAIPMSFIKPNDETGNDTGEKATEGVKFREDGASVSRNGKTQTFRDEYPIKQALWLGETDRIATAGHYKFYGSAISVWDTDTGTRLFGPLAGRELSEDSNEETLIAINRFDSIRGYQREIFTPTSTQDWLVDLGKAIVSKGVTSIPEVSSLPASLPPKENELARRLLSKEALGKLPMRVGSNITRSEWTNDYIPRLEQQLNKK